MKTLLVDDSSIDLKIFSRHLDRCDHPFEVDAFLSAKEALDQIAKLISQNPSEFPYSVIISDINMPAMNGFEFFTEIDSKYHELMLNSKEKPKFFIISSSENEEDIKRAQEISHFLGYLIKPISRKDFQEKFFKLIA